MKSVIIANITWNPHGWRNIYTNPKAGHQYARNFPGHESLNFRFDKPIDKNGRVHGYVQWTYPPKESLSGGMIIFYSHNLKTNNGEIVGVYGNADILNTLIKTPYPGFENNILISNIVADEELSILFPIPLDEKKYKQLLGIKRLVAQIGFRLIQNSHLLAKIIIDDEIIALKRSGIRQDELNKLVSIYEYIVGEQYNHELHEENKDIKEQSEIIALLKTSKERTKDMLIQELINLTPTDSETVEFAGKTYKRDNKTIACMKYLRDFKCQICGKQIITRDGNFYIEAAHIIPKHKKGNEIPENILILCSNHHKEFDLGDRHIIKHTKENITFQLNGITHSLSLSIK